MKRRLLIGLAALAVMAVASVGLHAQSAPPQKPTTTTVGPNFVDANGDGICDHFQNGTRPANGTGRGHGRGRGNGTHIGPQDGTGFGAPAGAGTGTGTGTCEGTGPKGTGRGRRR